MADGSDKSGVQVIARAGMILRLLEDAPDGLSLGQLARGANLPRSTVQRIVAALADEQLVMAASARARVRLGPALARLAAAAETDVEKIARPIMQDLSRAIDETVDLSLLKDGAAVFVEQVLSSQRLMAVSAVGEAFPLHCTANGKALLAMSPPDQRRRLIPRRLKARTPYTLVDQKALEAALEAATRTGLAWDLQEHTEHVCAVGAAFSDPFGRLYAISIPAPASRFDQKRDRLAEALLAARARIDAALTGSVHPRRRASGRLD